MHLDIEPNRQLHYLPRFVLGGRGIIVAPFTSAAEYDTHLAKTSGSGGVSDLGEVIRFDRNSGLLASAWVHLPETFERLPNGPDAWLAPPTAALPRLSGAPCDVDWPSSLAFDSEGSYLAGLLKPLTGSEQRLLVASDFELIVGAGVVGWVLHSPARYLTSNWDGAESNSSWQRLSPLLAEFLQCVDTDFVARLEEKDHGARQELIHLRAAALEAVTPCAQRMAFVDSIDSILSTF